MINKSGKNIALDTSLTPSSAASPVCTNYWTQFITAFRRTSRGPARECNLGPSARFKKKRKEKSQPRRSAKS